MPQPFFLVVPSGAKSADTPFTFGVDETIAALSVEADPIAIPGKTTTFSLQGPGVDQTTAVGDLSSAHPTFDFTNDPELQADPDRYELNVKLAENVGAETTITGNILFTGDQHMPAIAPLGPIVNVKQLYAPQGQAAAVFGTSGEPLAVGIFSQDPGDAEEAMKLLIGVASANGAAFEIQSIAGPSQRLILELRAANNGDISVKAVKPIARAGSHYTPVLHACGGFQLGRFCDSYDLACADRGHWSYISNQAIQAIEALPACSQSARTVTRVDHD